MRTWRSESSPRRSRSRLSRSGSSIGSPVARDRRCRVGSPYFENFFAAVILVNALVLLVETDFREEGMHLGWFLLDSAFNVVFGVELVVRVAATRRAWCRSPWNWFDALLVSTSVVDVWVLPVVAQSSSLRVLSLLRVMRLFRMLRILRILRVFRFAHQLVLLVHALWGALRAMVWGMVLLVMVLYIFGMLITRVAQMDEGITGSEKMMSWFGTLPRTLFTLFQLMTLEGWPDIAREAMEVSPWLTAFCICFILMTNITLLNTLAGVLTENVLSTSRKDEEARKAAVERQVEEELHMVAVQLAQMDDNGDGKLDLEELLAASNTPELGRFLELAGLTVQQAEALFAIVDHNDEGAVQREAFVDGVRRARGEIRSKHLFWVKRDITNLSLNLQEVTSLLEGVMARVVELQRQLEGPQVLEEQSDDSGHSPGEGSKIGGESSDTAIAEMWTVSAIRGLRREFHTRLSSLEGRLSQQIAQGQGFEHL